MVEIIDEVDKVTLPDAVEHVPRQFEVVVQPSACDVGDEFVALGARLQAERVGRDDRLVSDDDFLPRVVQVRVYRRLVLVHLGPFREVVG